MLINPSATKCKASKDPSQKKQNKKKHTFHFWVARFSQFSHHISLAFGRKKKKVTDVDWSCALG